MNIHIRPLNKEDRPEWEELWQSYLVFYQSSVESAQTELTWQRLCDERFNLHGLAAFNGNTMVGLTHYLFHPSTWTAKDYCYLQDLFVKHDQRGRGVAKALINAVVEKAQTHPAQRVYWLTQENNATARLLYDSVATPTGFIQYRIAPI